MRIALVAPPFGGSARGLPLGLAQLASILSLEGFEIHVLDLTVPSDDTTLDGFLQRVQPAVIGISTVCATYLDAVKVALKCRAVLGDSTKIVAGGPHVTFGAEVVLSHQNSIDICVLGEAELTFLELCKAINSADSEKWKSVPGIAFRHEGAVVRSQGRKFIPDLDDLPFPARDYFPQDKYLYTVGAFEASPTRNAELIASRGCPYPCGFCSTKEFWQKQYRKRSPENVIAELELLARAGRTDIYFNDDIFTVNRKWVLQLCDQLKDRQLGVKWACGTRVDRVDQELVRAMRDAGCAYVYYGVESGDDAINQTQKKGASISKIEEAYELLRGAGIYSSAALIFGLPGETWDTARQTIDWIRDVIQPDEVWISKATCYPGTELAQRYNVGAEDYEWRRSNRCRNGLLYGTGGIYTPFFNDTDLVARIWDYASSELLDSSVGFGDDFGRPVVEVSDA